MSRSVHLDLDSQGNGRPQWAGYRSPTALSPRLNHTDGDIPPALSPLDAFAEQGRLLAKQLEESRRNGRRMSRLPPLHADAFVRPGFYRSKSASAGLESDEAEDDIAPLERLGMVRETEDIPFRPKSFYPRLSGTPLLEDEMEDADWMQRRDSTATVGSEMGILGPLRTQSPDPLPDVPEEQTGRSAASSPQPQRNLNSGPPRNLARTESTDSHGPSPQPQSSVDSYRSGQVSRSASSSSLTPALRSQPSLDSVRRRGAVRQSSTGSRGPSPRPKRSLSSTRQQSLARKESSDSLAPPRSYGPTSAPRSPSMRAGASNGMRSVAPESDVEEESGMSASFGSIQRQASSSSQLSAPHSPQSFHGPPPRSPSISSEHSVGGPSQPRNLRPAMNFSRPRSSAGPRPAFDVSSRQTSSESQRSFFVDDSAHTPQSMNGEGYFDPNEPKQGAAPALVYSKYSLPRGRTLEKDSTVIQKKATHHFHWEESNSSAQLVSQRPAENRPPSPESPPRATMVPDQRPATPEQAKEEPKSAASPQLAASAPGRPASPSVDSNSTIKAGSSRRSLGASMELTAEDHLAKGIACHQKGSLNESTYHLRIAARKNHPTAMLLYALACRHGWGMRPNQREGVQWLRKAVDSAGLEVADDETPAKNAKPSDIMERKAHRNQLALGIYELGISHMNGWGIEQDKGLALRCFEIAGTWGDADALAEAGFCYAKGVGCKKDLKKAAKFYRMAESKGMSMVGNSWIYKDKYKDDDDDRQSRATKKDNNDKAGRDKSRTRTMFGRKRSVNRA
ncbi:hypothetical protein L228DRAFT_242395 [Xylona heveae TC161]|uniref:HCP-like protein n=1 Tax=Xylona heveae (strain CBS 132557 / TC161) TaxID=1328760 RepID=A0A165JB80_XYLHT|nr:hypothetical protein L228DRAFT_242395 [Xylona heveae TC161]KZF26001.1 hypothetical protein L228DRAFT_242395 [Xylona heveae TC161]